MWGCPNCNKSVTWGSGNSTPPRPNVVRAIGRSEKGGTGNRNKLQKYAQAHYHRKNTAHRQKNRKEQQKYAQAHYYRENTAHGQDGNRSRATSGSELQPDQRAPPPANSRAANARGSVETATPESPRQALVLPDMQHNRPKRGVENGGPTRPTTQLATNKAIQGITPSKTKGNPTRRTSTSNLPRTRLEPPVPGRDVTKNKDS